jgi:hypothetical protein
MTNEQILAEVVRAWAEELVPGDGDVSRHAERIALEWFRQGATVSEACRQAGVFVDSWLRHPAHWSGDRYGGLRLAS